MRIRLVLIPVCCILLSFGSCIPRPGLEELKLSYIQKWKEFYPTRALAAGDRQAASIFEYPDQAAVDAWVRYNRLTANTGAIFNRQVAAEDRINIRLLVRQARLELDFWETKKGYINNPTYYSGLVSQAMTHLLMRDRLTPEEKAFALKARLSGVSRLCRLGMEKLERGRPHEIASAVANLESSADFYEGSLQKLAAAWEPDLELLGQRCRQTAEDIRALAAHIRGQVSPELADIRGYDDYAAGLLLYTDQDLTPEALAESALAEMKLVRGLMVEESQKWWQDTQQDAVPDNVLDLALAAMENERQANEAGFLDEFSRLTDEAEKFVIEQNIATVPMPRTLKIALSPKHFAGAAVGGVYSSGPFDPEAATLFYLPSIPDSSSQEARDGFYRSFNTHFNTMIIAHELYPGHYLQQKISSANPHQVRTLFSNPVTVEGWGSFCELLTLDLGWGNRLTRLAHLRKRLENATRAYTSVKVHCDNWSKEQLKIFAVEEGLLPPQFAANLRDRVMRSPFQITSYYLGFTAFVSLYEQEKARLGKDFNTRSFTDRVLSEGGIPVELISFP